MRVSTKALAPFTALLFFASCVTPPPMPRSDRDVAYGDPRYEEPRGSWREDRQRREVRPTGERLAPVDNRRFDDGRFNRTDRDVVTAAYDPASSQRGRDDVYYDDEGYYDEGYGNPVPPHERRGQYSEPTNGRISFLFGRRELEDELFEPTERLFNFGVEFAQAVEPGSLGLEFGFAFGRDDQDNVDFIGGPTPGSVDVERDMGEIYLGVRSEFGHSNIRPYIGGGATLMNMTETRSQGFLSSEDDDTVLGGYLHGGIQFDLNEAFFLGVDYRKVFGSNYELYGQDIDSDYGQLSVVLGVSL